MNKLFLQKLRMVASEADDLLTSCDASDLLDGLEVARDFMFESANVIEELESRLAQAERERDTAVRDLKKISFCEDCKNLGKSKKRNPCRECQENYKEKPNWQWRGVCPENTKGGNENV